MSDLVTFIIGLVLGGIMLYVARRIVTRYNLYTPSSAPPPDPLKSTEEFLSNIREAVIDQILNNQPQLFAAIAKQRIILADQEREPVAIFLNKSIFKQLLCESLGTDHQDEVDDLYDAMHGLDMPVGHLGALPIYVTELLKQAPIFVAGGIQWTM